MVKRATPLEIYKLLDKSNCHECGKESCLEFASQLLERAIDINKCPHLLHLDQQQNYLKIKNRLKPPQRMVTFGVAPRTCILGGEEVIFRHERTFYNQTALAVEIHDEMGDAHDVANYLQDLVISRIGEDLRLNALAVRYVSGNPKKYIDLVKQLTQENTLPIILCCIDPAVLKQAATAIQDYRPLLYAATPETAEEMGRLARDLSLPLVCTASTLDLLYQMVTSLAEFGIKDLVLNPQVYSGPGLLSLSYNQIQRIRHQLFDHGFTSLGYPILGVPAAVWVQKDFKDAESADNEEELWKFQYKEITLATILESIDTNLLILHTGRNSKDIWGLLALMTYRQNIFTDPRIYPRVEPGLVSIGKPHEWSPIYVTSNYRMTKIPVEQDLIDSELNGYLLVVDTEGIGIESATAGGQFNEERIKKALDDAGLFEKVKHRIVILPGMSARLQAPLEELAKVEVWTGPRDSSGIAAYIQELWVPEEIQKKYQ